MKIKHLKMKFSVILTVFCALQAFAIKSNAQKIEVDVNNEPIEKVIELIKSQSDYKFFYQDDLIKDDWTVSLKAQSHDLHEILDKLFKDFPIAFVVNKQQVILKNKIEPTAKPGGTTLKDNQRQLQGTVRDENRAPLMGVTVWLRGTRTGTTTNENGIYRITASAGDTLVFNYLGYKEQDFVVGDQTTINVSMIPEVNTMNEVKIVSTGYQKIARERATGSFSTITSEELEKVQANNIIHQLEGRVAGLQIDLLEADNTFVYGNLLGEIEGNTSYNFRIRGQSTYRANDMPLIVIDGVPTEMDIRTLNSDDIETITFLKDAASASIYGARAANGVIVIDTKRGRQGKTRINYSQTYTFSAKPSLSSLPLMNSAEILELEQELIDKGAVQDPFLATSLFSSTPISSGMEIMFRERRGEITAAERDTQLNILRSRNNYNHIEDHLLQPASSINHNLSLAGGTENYSYFTSASFAEEKTQSRGTDGKRLTLTANQDFTLFNYAEVNASLKGSFFNYNQNGLGLSPLAGSSFTYLPYNEIANANGEGIDFYHAFYGREIDNFEAAGYLPWRYNYLDELENSDKTIKEQNYSANVQVTLPIAKGLRASGTYFIERSYKNNSNIFNENTYFTRNLINQATFIDPETEIMSRGIPLGAIFQKNEYTESSQTGRGQLDYNGLYGNHAFDAIAGIELRQTIFEESGGTLYGYNTMTQTSIDLPATNYRSVYGFNSTISYNNTETNQRRRFLSYYANGAYTYNNKYVISGSVRLDDYNNFGVDKKYRRTPLWSTGFKWNASNEDFLQDVDFISHLSFRASYGFNGNISLTTFPFTNIAIANIDWNLSQLPYAFISAAANPALRWEKTGILNFGLDFGLLQNRLSGSLEYYRKRSEDLIQDFPVSVFYGLPNNSLTRNTATLEGKGIDLNLNANWLREKAFNINTSFILSYNENEVTDSRYESYAAYLNGTGTTPPIIGYGLNSIFAFRSAGLDENGSTLIYDRNGDIVNSFTQITEIEDMKFMGTSTPQYYGSLGTTFSYNKLSLFVLATYKLDYVLFKPTFGGYMTRFGTFNGYDLNSEIANRWREPGDEANTNVPGIQGLGGFSYSRYRFGDSQVIEGDHIRLREVSLNYDLSSLLSSTFITRATLALSARNLGFLWRANNDDIDPDFLPVTTGNQIRIPPTSMYTIGLNVNF